MSCGGIGGEVGLYIQLVFGRVGRGYGWRRVGGVLGSCIYAHI